MNSLLKIFPVKSNASFTRSMSQQFPQEIPWPWRRRYPYPPKPWDPCPCPWDPHPWDHPWRRPPIYYIVNPQLKQIEMTA